MNQHYAKAIDILMGPAVDFKAMCIELAKQNPELFCSLVANVAQAQPVKDNEWHAEAIQFMRDNLLGSAIKLCREKTGFGIKEAKDVMGAVRGRDNDLWFSPVNLHSEQVAVYKEMIRSL